MEYKVNELARLAGVSTRTLRYYDEIGLLTPSRVAQNGYRLYGADRVDRLQQILFYRAMGLELAQIGELLDAPGFDRAAALEEHLRQLRQEQERLQVCIRTVERTLMTEKGEIAMTDEEKFEGFKQQKICENEEKYGAEARARYGEQAVEGSNARVAGMSRGDWESTEQLQQRMFDLLRAAREKQDPTCPEALEAAELHHQWIAAFWTIGTYTKAAHAALVEGYVADPRFADYYDSKLGKGTTEFLRDAVVAYTKK